MKASRLMAMNIRFLSSERDDTQATTEQLQSTEGWAPTPVLSNVSSLSTSPSINIQATPTPAMYSLFYFTTNQDQKPHPFPVPQAIQPPVTS